MVDGHGCGGDVEDVQVDVVAAAGGFGEVWWAGLAGVGVIPGQADDLGPGWGGQTARRRVWARNVLRAMMPPRVKSSRVAMTAG